MARIEGPKYTGDLTFDLTAVKDDLYDVPPGGLQGARGPGDELDAVLAELAATIPQYGDTLEIHPNVHQRIIDAGAKIELLNKATVFYTKLLEVIVESKTRLVNNREEDIADVGAKAEKAGTKGKQPEMLAHFEKTIRYKSRNADKAAETRKKNEEEAKAKAEAEAKAKAEAEAKAKGGQAPA
jgi:hypothetical protein